MDPLSQITLGAAAAALASNQENVRRAILVGAVAGGLPDLDVLIRSAEDPLLSLQYHRHFTHALLFAPVIGFVVALLTRAFFPSRGWSFRELLVFATLGAASHGLLDACTSYGTMLYLPLSQHRESWDLISIIDPIFTLPLVMLVVVAFVARKPNAARIGVLFCLVYLSFGFVQGQRAQAYGERLAESRGVDVESITTRPSFANTILWRIIVDAGDVYYVDAVWLMPFRDPKLYEGSRIPRVDAGALAVAGSRQASDIARFNHFSQGFIYLVPGQDDVLGDLRYSLFPDSVAPLWGIRLSPETSDAHVAFEHFRDPSREAVDRLMTMIRGEDLEAPASDQTNGE